MNGQRTWTRLRVVAVLTASLLPFDATAETLHVPAEYRTIQDAIDAASDGDEVVVADGTYRSIGNVNLDPLGKAITIRSANGPSACTIDCMSDARAFTITNGEGADTVIQGFRIVDGKAFGLPEEDGGGIYIHSASPTIRDCHVSGCGAFRGGGMFVGGSNAKIIDCTFRYNRQNYSVKHALIGSGGGVACRDGGQVELIRCDLSFNSATLGGGLSSNEVELTVRDCTIEHNLVDFDRLLPEGGGGVYLLQDSVSPVHFIGCSISHNTVVNSTGDSGGGGLSSRGINVVLERCRIEGNEILGYRPLGGGVQSVRGEVTLNDCIIADNQSVSFAGDEYRRGGGAGAASEGGRLILERCVIARNTSFNGDGGGVLGANRVSDCRIIDNFATVAGGGCHRVWALNGCIVIGNEADQGGGSSDLRDHAVNSVIAGNRARVGGGAVQHDSISRGIINCTIVENVATEIGGGTAIRNGEIVLAAPLYNCVFWDNSAPVGSQLGLVEEGAAAVLAYCNIEYGLAGIAQHDGTELAWDRGMIQSSPQFVDRLAGDFRISPGSPCIDAGDADRIADLTTVDLLGRPRWVDDLGMPDSGPLNSDSIDIGAHEYQGTSAAFVVARPVPGTPGARSVVQVAGAIPHRRVVLVYGLATGHTEIPFCPGVFVSIGEPLRTRIATADDVGKVNFVVHIPRRADRGIGLFIQAITEDCDKTQPVGYWPPTER